MYDTSIFNLPCRDNNDKYYGIQSRLKKESEPQVGILGTYLWFQDDAKSQSTKTWFDMGIFPFYGRITTNGYLLDKTSCYSMFDTGASKAMLSGCFMMNILHYINTIKIPP